MRKLFITLGVLLLFLSCSAQHMTEGISGSGILADEVVYMKADTIDGRFSLGINHANDADGFFDGAYMGGWYNYQDSVVALVVKHDVQGASADVDFRIVYSTDYFNSGITPTVIYSGTSTTAGGGVTSTTFTTKFIPPDVDIWCEIDGTPTVAGTLIIVDFGYAKILE